MVMNRQNGYESAMILNKQIDFEWAKLFRVSKLIVKKRFDSE